MTRRTQQLLMLMLAAAVVIATLRSGSGGQEAIRAAVALIVGWMGASFWSAGISGLFKGEMSYLFAGLIMVALCFLIRVCHAGDMVPVLGLIEWLFPLRYMTLIG